MYLLSRLLWDTILCYYSLQIVRSFHSRLWSLSFPKSWNKGHFRLIGNLSMLLGLCTTWHHWFYSFSCWLAKSLLLLGIIFSFYYIRIFVFASRCWSLQPFLEMGKTHCFYQESTHGCLWFCLASPTLPTRHIPHRQSWLMDLLLPILLNLFTSKLRRSKSYRFNAVWYDRLL